MPSEKRTPWNAAQFFSTLSFFGEIPFVGSFRWLQVLIGQSKTFPGVNLSDMKKPVWVIGSLPAAEFESLQQRLPLVALRQLSEGDAIAALSSDFASDRHQPLRRQVEGAEAIVIAEVKDFSALIQQFAGVLKPSIEQSVFDFTVESSDLAAWGSLDDVVMGGVSEGRLVSVSESAVSGDASDRCALFTGTISTDNSGGFSSVRTQNFEPPFNLAGFEGLRLYVKGDGQRYKFIARNSAGWDSPAYIYSFDTQSDGWISVDIPFSELVATFRARSVPDAAPFDPSKIFSFQLMLSKFEYDRQLNPSFSAGKFAIAIKRISAYRDRPSSALVVLGSQDEQTRGQQQAALTEAQVGYRLIEPGNTSSVDAIVDALS